MQCTKAEKACTSNSSSNSAELGINFFLLHSTSIYYRIDARITGHDRIWFLLVFLIVGAIRNCQGSVIFYLVFRLLELCSDFRVLLCGRQRGGRSLFHWRRFPSSAGLICDPCQFKSLLQERAQAASSWEKGGGGERRKRRRILSSNSVWERRSKVAIHCIKVYTDHHILEWFMIT